MKKKATGSTSKTPGKLAAKDFGALIAEVRGLIQSARYVPRISQKPSAQLALKEYQLYLPSKELLRQKLLDWTRDQEDGAWRWRRSSRSSTKLQESKPLSHT